MLRALEGFTTIGVVVLGAVLLTQLGFLDRRAQDVLTKLCFFVAGPALMVTIMAGTDTSVALSAVMAATGIGVAASAVCYLLAARLVWRRNLGETVIGSMSAAYVNAGNLGLPVATYILGDPAYIAPVLLLQLGLLQPIAMFLLDLDAGGDRRPSRILIRTLSNPMTVATVIGLLLGPRLPELVLRPVELVGGIAVPGMLIAYGIALRLGFGPGSQAPRVEVGMVVVLKLLVQPAVAWLSAVWFGLSGPAVFAVTVAAALPTAQNVFTHATRYDRAAELTRLSILLSTVGCVPVILVIAALLE